MDLVIKPFGESCCSVFGSVSIKKEMANPLVEKAILLFDKDKRWSWRPTVGMEFLGF